jgi:hypothetical protein
MKKIEFSLPEFVFLDGNSHQGNTLEGRTIIQHVRSYTVLEAFMPNEFKRLHLDCPVHEFSYTNAFGIIELHVLALHFTMASESELPEIFVKSAAWYAQYLAWEDKNLQHDEISKHN